MPYFLISTCEELSLQMKHAKNIFFDHEGHKFDTHDMFEKLCGEIKEIAQIKLQLTLLTSMLTGLVKGREKGGGSTAAISSMVFFCS